HEGIYKTFYQGKQPQFDTIWKITKALGLTVMIGCGESGTHSNTKKPEKRRRKRGTLTAG
ncbi:MAG: hypothetical protein LIP23_00125, partial [Planctomycetes bacterium]|nr:hypothetical protein [Planctomycetota bacterium]